MASVWAPDDPGIAARTGFAAVENYSQFKNRLAHLEKSYHDVYTIVPQQRRHRLSARARIVGMADQDRAKTHPARCRARNRRDAPD